MARPDIEATVAPFDVIEFEKRLHAGASDDYAPKYPSGMPLSF
jgi:hypothetical protein